MGLNKSSQWGTHTTTHLPPLVSVLNGYFYLIQYKLKPVTICEFSEIHESHLQVCELSESQLPPLKYYFFKYLFVPRPMVIINQNNL